MNAEKCGEEKLPSLCVTAVLGCIHYMEKMKEKEKKDKKKKKKNGIRPGLRGLGLMSFLQADQHSQA